MTLFESGLSLSEALECDDIDVEVCCGDQDGNGDR
jgi:hypothetical protein